MEPSQSSHGDKKGSKLNFLLPDSRTQSICQMENKYVVLIKLNCLCMYTATSVCVCVGYACWAVIINSSPL